MARTLTLDVNQVFLAMHMAPNVWQQIPLIKIDFEKTGDLLKNVNIGANNLVAFNELIDDNGDYIINQRS